MPSIATAAKPADVYGRHDAAELVRVMLAATWPSSRALLDGIGMHRGARVLQIGCGTGESTQLLAAWAGPEARVVGADRNAESIEIARSTHGDAPVEYRVLDIEREAPAWVETYDLVVLRFVLSRLKMPEAALRHVLAGLRRGGTVVVEDIDVRGHFCHPPCDAFDRYVELYQALARRRGADACIGPRLRGALASAGVHDVQLRVALPTFAEGDGKRLAVLAMTAIRDAIVAAQLATASEADGVIAELDTYTRNEGTMLSLPRIFQVWGRK
jgi:ubiquinone/menaquinone biosynthesis C-methylase UbiE